MEVYPTESTLQSLMHPYTKDMPFRVARFQIIVSNRCQDKRQSLQPESSRVPGIDKVI